MLRANKIVILLILFSFINIQNLSLFLTFDFHCISILFSSRFSLLQPFSLHRWTVSIRVYGYADGEEAFSIDLN